MKNYPRIENCIRRAAKFSYVRTANESFNCNENPLFAACKFSSNRNVALHARRFGPPWYN